MAVFDYLDRMKGIALDIKDIETIKHHGLLLEQNNSALRESNSLLGEKIRQLEESMADLVKNNADLAKEVSSYREKERYHLIPEGFAFLELDTGKLDSVPRCPNCFRVLGFEKKEWRYTCPQCKYGTSIRLVPHCVHTLARPSGESLSPEVGADS